MWFVFFFFFKQKTAYEITEGDWSSDVCSSDLVPGRGLDHFPTQQVVERLALPRHVVAIAFDQDLGRPGSLVVGRAHHEAVGARAEHRQVLAGLDYGELAVEREEITGFTDGTHDVHHFLGSTAVLEGDDLVMGVVMAGPHEVRHPRVHHDETFATSMLAV